MKDHQFKPGQSGNPKGRPKGIKDRRNQYRDMIESNAEGLINKAVEMALSGDSQMIKLCIDRLVSPYRAVDPKVMIDELTGSLTEQGQKIITEMSKGEITPSDASSMLQAMAAQARIKEVDDLEERITRLEEKRN